MCKDIRVHKGFCWCWSICSTPSRWGSVPGVRWLRIGLNRARSTCGGMCCCCSVAQLCPKFCILWTAARQCSLSFTVSYSLLKLMVIESVMPSNHLSLCRSLLLLPSIFPSIRVFSISQVFTSGGQTIGASTLALILPVNIQGWFPLGLTGLSFLLSKRLSRVFSSTTVWKHQFFGSQPSLWSKSHICTWLLEKP